jgi:hypothetical protein
VANCAETTITLTDAPDDGERAMIMDGLRAYNEAQAGGSDARPLAILVRDPETTKVAGGLCHGNERRLGRGQGPARAHAAATAFCHCAAASALKIRSVDRETRCR